MRRPIQDVFIKCARHCHCLCRRMGNAIMYLFFCVCEPVGRNLCARRLLDVLLAFVQLLLLHHRNRFRNKKCVDVCAAYAFSFRLAQSIQQQHEHIVSPVAGRRSAIAHVLFSCIKSCVRTFGFGVNEIRIQCFDVVLHRRSYTQRPAHMVLLFIHFIHVPLSLVLPLCPLPHLGSLSNPFRTFRNASQI